MVVPNGKKSHLRFASIQLEPISLCFTSQGHKLLLEIFDSAFKDFNLNEMTIQIRILKEMSLI